MAAELNSSDYAFLIILGTEDRTVSNNEMSERHDVRLVSPAYEKLNAEGLIESETKGRPYRHVITEKGKKLLAAPLALEDDVVEARKKRTPTEKVLWAALVAARNETRRPPESPDRRDLDRRIRAAYDRLAGAPGEWVDLTALRPLFTDVSKAQLNKALVAMLESPDVRLEPEPLTHRIGAEERIAAVNIGGEDRHKLAIGSR